MTKKLAIMGSEKFDIMESIVDYLRKNNSDIYINIISNVQNSELLAKAEDLNLNSEYLEFEDNTKYFASHDFDLIALTDYNEPLAKTTLETGKFLNIHPSLLPSFKGANAIQRAFVSGVKVSGVTVYTLNSDIEKEKTLAQYPVLIGVTTHLDEFEKDIYDIEKKLYPPVIDAVLKDKVFDFQDLFRSGCHHKGGCSGCGGCH